MLYNKALENSCLRLSRQRRSITTPFGKELNMCDRAHRPWQVLKRTSTHADDLCLDCQVAASMIENHKSQWLEILLYLQAHMSAEAYGMICDLAAKKIRDDGGPQSPVEMLIQIIADRAAVAEGDFETMLKLMSEVNDRDFWFPPL